MKSIMSPKTKADETQTVLLAADIGNVPVATLDLAVAIASSANSLLQAVFVEDIDLLQLSGLPCSREISLSSAHERPTSSDQMQRSLRAVAQQFRQALEREARAGQVGWSFDYVRGRLRDIGLQRQRLAMYTVLAWPARHRPSLPGTQRVQNVLLLDEVSPRLLHLVALLIELANGNKIEFTLAMDDGRSKLAQAIEEIGASADNTVSIVEVEPQQLAAQLTAWQGIFDLAVIGRRLDFADLQDMLPRLNCPVVLVA